MATLLSYCTANTIHCVVWRTINKVTVKIIRFTQSLALMKDSLRESVGVVELKMISSLQIFLVRSICFKQLLDDISPFDIWFIDFQPFHDIPWYNVFTQISKYFMFLLLFMTLEYPFVLGIYLWLLQKRYNSLLIYKKSKTFKGESGGCRVHLATLSPHDHA